MKTIEFQFARLFNLQNTHTSPVEKKKIKTQKQ